MARIFKKLYFLINLFLIVLVIIFLLIPINAFSKTYIVKDQYGKTVRITNSNQLSVSEKEAGYTVFVLIEDKFPQHNYKSINGVVSVIDGDTIDLYLFGSGTSPTIRLNGIDCPEKGQPFYEEAKDYTSVLCLHKQVEVIRHDIDKYGRIVADIILPDGRNLGEELVRAGLAWFYDLYSDDPILERLEEIAKSQRIGLWNQDNPIPPWDFRKIEDLGEISEEDNDNTKWTGDPIIYPSGMHARKGDNCYYPNGIRVNINSHFYYPNGQRVNIDNNYYYPNGKYLNIGKQYFYSNGQRVNIGSYYFSSTRHLLDSPPESLKYDDGEIYCAFSIDISENKPHRFAIVHFYDNFNVSFIINRENIVKIILDFE